MADMAAPVEDCFLIDAEDNVQYKVVLSPQDAERARSDMEYATKLLEYAKSMCVAQSLNATENQCPNKHTNEASTANENTTVEVSPLFEKEDAQHMWSNAETLLLLDLYHADEKKFHSGKTSQKNCWATIAQKMCSKGHNISGHKCATKFQSLKRTYKNVIAHNAKSGNDRKEWEYFDVMDNMFANKPWVKPLSLAGSNIVDTVQAPTPRTSQSVVRKAKVDSAILKHITDSAEDRRLRRESQDQRHREKMSALNELKEMIKQMGSQ